MPRWIWVAGFLGCLLVTATGKDFLEEFQIGGILQPVSMTPYGQNASEHMGNVSQAESDGGEEPDDAQGITYGSDVNVYRRQYPYVVLILIYYYYYYYHICTGIIINQHSVLTTAHCLKYIRYYPYYVAVGVRDLRSGPYGYGSQFIRVTGHEKHPGYDPSQPGYPNNLAMLHLRCRIRYNYFIRPAPLANRYDGRYVNYYCYLVGWGRTEWGYPNRLQHALVFGISNYYCRLFWAIDRRARILNTHICGYRYPRSGCFGDGGGPLVCGGKVVGLISWGQAGCIGCNPTVCSRITSYRGWIRAASTLN